METFIVWLHTEDGVDHVYVARNQSTAQEAVVNCLGSVARASVVTDARVIPLDEMESRVCDACGSVDGTALHRGATDEGCEMRTCVSCGDGR